MAGPLRPRCVISIFSRKLLRSNRCDNLSRDSGKIAEMRRVVLIEGERHQRCPGLDDLQSKLASQVITETCSAHLGNREATGGDNQ